MTSIVHFATCRVWVVGQWSACDCLITPVWRIRKDSAGQFPWHILRRTGDVTYEHVMRCSSWEGAVELVLQFIWLRNNAVQRETRA